MEEQYLLKVDNLHTHFFTKTGVVKAVDGVSFSIRSGETLGIVGESGSGKSITALSIMKLVPNPPGRIVEGAIYYNGEDLMSKSEKQMRRIRGNKLSMIFQDPMTSLNPVFTIGRQLVETVRAHRDLSKRQAEARAIELLTLVGIPDPKQRLKNYPHEFSGGMRQRVMIAMALACDPELLIADEPTTALDVTVQAQILELLKRLQEELGMAIIMITHDLGVVAEICDRVMVMYAGRQVEFTNRIALFDHPKHPYTWGLLDSIPKMEKEKRRLQAIAGHPPDLRYLPQGCYFADRCKQATEECKMHEPTLTKLDDHHLVRCLLYEDIKVEST
ncbi:ABC transporter ATP-binding protein [Pullulanibacillus camelliae]|uniref:ABC transporter ATP-binding protein n=1 Tax=Pullulanibacillus camelliae TaxID=1707096 RepID=A0A8J2VEJ8_9BACL|nr:ABC transporter ATP-binding protein [Pullulanibacillus camelliae]GGE29053.1 ABC transporter ATP-binding protein [Pullulanibacillus camelliae]